MSFDPDRVYTSGELTLERLSEEYTEGLRGLEAAQRAAPAWEEVDGVRQLVSSGVVFLPDEKDRPEPPGTALGRLGCIVFLFAAPGFFALLLSSRRPVELTWLMGALFLGSIPLIVRAKPPSNDALTPILRTGLYLFPDALLFVTLLGGVAFFPRALIVGIRVVRFSDSTRTSVMVEGEFGEEEQNLVGCRTLCPRLQRWRAQPHD